MVQGGQQGDPTASTSVWGLVLDVVMASAHSVPGSVSTRELELGCRISDQKGEGGW